MLINRGELISGHHESPDVLRERFNHLLKNKRYANGRVGLLGIWGKPLRGVPGHSSSGHFWPIFQGILKCPEKPNL